MTLGNQNPQMEESISDNIPLETALTPDVWETVSRQLLAKMLSTFMYEEIITPVPEGDAGTDDRIRYRLPMDTDSDYRFEATQRLLDSYHVYEETVERRTDGAWRPATDPIQFLRDLQPTVGIDPLTAGNLIREYNNTLLADAHIEARSRKRGATDITELGYAHLEGEMDGHPWITYNKGRLGWGYTDYRSYAPEQQRPITLSWVAVSRENATFSAVDGVSHDSLVQAELGDHYQQFRNQLSSDGLDPDSYYFLPIHDWQWDNSIVQLFPGDIATDDIVPLGNGPDRYLPQQSVRTFVNVDSLDRHHVKLPMCILNTLVWRGLPGSRTELAPTITEYIKGIYETDEFLSDVCDLILPGEIAGINYDHEDFTAIDGVPYQYTELLGTIWRESIYTFVEENEQPITLAALTHVENGTPYLSQLVERSGLTLDEWLERFFDVVLPPLLHFLYRYGTVFSPHGQNTILILEDGVPTRLAVKDFVDDVNVSDQPLPELEALPDELRSVLRTEPPEGLCQFIFSGLFVGVLRYVADVLETHHGYDERRLWTHARETILRYQDRFPELQDRFELFDLLQPEFTKLCLNRNRLLEYGYGDAPGRPHASEHGTVRNALDVVGED
ncbi:IucA/IucC family siderophore biosynthesis protein [Halocatena salina]|uniref:IucA/IucC family siderophore biosynthesis protein n=2 Tax=Halocatena salina TaxID=2934340 RepID=A0A8T9ZZ35_9EURY|nr:IucA/IucC family siderophore biosynthesis protein [Halocatena salina]UPM42010.1 IucA/IucC family siderophore biosynthesis protein [Halocatena salina]